MASRPPGRDNLLRQAEQARASAARLQRIADEKFDRARGANNKNARAQNGQWEREQALKLIAQAEEFERRAEGPAFTPTAPKPQKKPAVASPKQNKPSTFDWSKAPKPSTEPQEPGLETILANRTDRSVRTGTSISEVFNINSFRSELLENEVLPSHSYLVTFAPFRDVPGSNVKENAPLTDFVLNKRNTLMMRCENVVLPTPSLLEEENIRRYGYGPVEKVPYGVQFSDVTMTWVVDKNSEIIDFFHQWMNTIIMHDSPNSLMSRNFARPGLKEYEPFELGYKDSYANPIVRIYVYNRQNQTTTTYEMYDVFPMNIQSINLSWADENEVQKLTVTFAYVNMKVEAPMKASMQQLNFLEEGKNVNYFSRSAEEQQFINDFAESPLSERFTRTMNKSNPTIKDPFDFSDSQPAPALPAPIRRTI